MRVTRGLFASLGASGCIAAAGACALLAVSMAVGFRGWPGLSATPVSSGTITGSAVRTAAHRRLSIVPAGSPRRVLAATEAPSSDMPRTPGATGGARAVTHARPTPHGAAGTPAGAGAAAAGAPTGTDAPAGAGETVRRTGSTVARQVAPVSPAAAQTVSGATDTAGAVADRTGDTVSHVLKP